MVKKKALELEQTMKIEDNIEESKVKAKEEAERRAAIVKFNEEPGMNNLSLDDDPYTVSDPNTMLKYLGFQPN